MKPWYKSKTYVSAIASFAVLLLNTTYSLWDEGQKKFNPPTEAQIILIMTGLGGLHQTLEGRKNATEKIGSTPSTLAEFEETDTPPFDLDGDGQYTLRTLQTTWFKSEPVQSTLLDPSEKEMVTSGESIKIDSWAYSVDGHLFVDGYMYVYAPHVELLNPSGDKVNLQPPPTPSKPSQATQNPPSNIIQDTRGLTPVQLPGYKSTFYLENPIYPGSHFTWSEALRGGSRMPYKKSQVDNIIAIAKHLDQIRKILGNRPMRIISWLRPDRPVNINAQVGGAKNSRHIQGDGVDFTIPGGNLFQAQNLIRPYCQSNGLGLGLGAPKGFIHLDLAGYREWNY